jgi:hypothetical protein
VRDGDGTLDDGHRDFELEYEHRCAADQRRLGVDVVRRQRAVGAGGEHDAVLADVFDENHGDAGADTRVCRTAVNVDAVSGQSVAQRCAETVVADLSDHATLAPSRAQATAWLAPLPPGRVENS